MASVAIQRWRFGIQAELCVLIPNFSIYSFGISIVLQNHIDIRYLYIDCFRTPVEKLAVRDTRIDVNVASQNKVIG